MDCIVEDEFCGGIIEAHHITQCGRRLGHFFCLPLCQSHHEGTKLSIGNTKKSFMARYGTELELLEKVNEILGIQREYAPEKDRSKDYFLQGMEVES